MKYNIADLWLIFSLIFLLFLLYLAAGSLRQTQFPPASYVMDFIFWCSDSSHVSVDTVHTSLLRPSSYSFPRLYNLYAPRVFFFKPLLPNCGVAAEDTILLQSVLSWTSSSVVPIALMSRLKQTIYLHFGRPLLLFPGCTISSVFLPLYSWSRLFTCPTHIRHASCTSL